MNRLRSLVAHFPSAPLWSTFVLFQCLDAVVYPLRVPVKHFDIGIYLISCLMNFLFFAWLRTCYELLPRRGRIVAAVVFGFLLAFLAIANTLVYREMGDYLSLYMLMFIKADPQYALNFATSYLLNINLIWLLLLWGLLSAVWYPHPTKKESLRMPVAIAGIVLLPVLYLVSLNYINIHGRQSILSTTAATGLAIRDVARAVPNPKKLCASRHQQLRLLAGKERPDFNIVVIVNESWGRHGLPFYGSSDTAMPFLTDWIRSDSAGFFVFRKAYTNSSATDVSVPSLMTGVAPYESSSKLHKIPFLWDWAHAAGMPTLFVTAQRYTWARLDNFFFTPGPDVYVTAETMNMPQINDTGVDELYASDRFCRELNNLPKDRPFFAVYNSNAIHAPFQQTSAALSTQPSFSQPYYNAAWLLDRSFKHIYETLQHSGKLENTLFIFTSDHGEYLTGCRECTPRILAFNRTIMSIPFLVRIPSSWQTTHPDVVAALRTNVSRPVSNIDIAPTIAALLGFLEKSDNGKIAHELVGSPLSRPLPQERLVISLNTNDIRSWEHEGFSIYTDKAHFSFSNLTGIEYFDLVRDSTETVNLWESVADSEQAHFMQIIDSTHHLKRIFTTYKPVPPVATLK